MDPLLVDRNDGVVTLTMNRPDAMNALDVPLKEALRDTLAAMSADPSVRAVVLTGAGTRAFCVGQDLREHVGFLQSGSDTPLRTVAEHYNPIATAIATMPKPVVAGINGVAAGAGAGFAFAADYRVLADTASLNTAFAGVGLGPDSGMSWTLPRLVGHGRAQELLLFPRTIKAAEALELGLVHQVVAAADLPGVALGVAQKLAAGPTVAYAAIKESLAYAAASTLPAALAREAELQSRAGESVDHREAVTSFVAKRPPNFVGR